MGLFGILGKIGNEVRHALNLLLLFSAMVMPNSQLKRLLYRLRGTSIGERTDIAALVFMDEMHTERISIGDNVDIGPRAILLTHDSSQHTIRNERSTIVGDVDVEDNCFIGAGAIILPGVRVGAGSIVAAGSVVANDVPPSTLVGGVPARKIKSL